MLTIRINKHKPKNWKGVHIVLCEHCFGNNVSKYAMYCDIEKYLKHSNNVKITVYGNRLRSIVGSRIKYVHKSKIKLYADYFKD